VFTLISGNTFGATVWTDGKMIAPMLPKPPEVTRCHECDGFYWSAEAEKIGEVSSPMLGPSLDDVEPEWAEAPYIQELEEEEFWLALSSGLASTQQQEMRLRILAWWRSNDPWREEIPPGELIRSDEAKLNMEMLIELLDEADPSEMLMKAEILRQLARFDESIGVLRSIDAPELEAPRDQIMGFAVGMSSALVKLGYE
jgi:hypothetical protein